MTAFETHERAPGWEEYRLGVYGSRDGYVVVAPSSTAGRDEPDVWDIQLHVCGAGTIQEITGLDVAKALALTLFETLMPMQKLARERSERRYQEFEAERRARQEEERPGREKAARELAKRLAKAPVEEAAKCPECSHVDEPDEFGVPGYECSRCGSTGRGEDGRRCDQCHIFRARTTDLSCPSCEAPLDATEAVSVKWDDREAHEVPTEGAPK
jgi:hypothetical protein